MTVRIEALPTDIVEALRNGGNDSYGHKPERSISDGVGIPCRHCLKGVKKGEEFLVVAHRPFSATQPYAETGPIFLHAEPCERAAAGSEMPEILESESYIVRGYDADERIVYGTGQVVPTQAISQFADELLKRPDIAFVHVRSAQNNCYQMRIESA